MRIENRQMVCEKCGYSVYNGSCRCGKYSLEVGFVEKKSKKKKGVKTIQDLELKEISLSEKKLKNN